jgi:hypothetical protein
VELDMKIMKSLSKLLYFVLEMLVPREGIIRFINTLDAPVS